MFPSIHLEKNSLIANIKSFLKPEFYFLSHLLFYLIFLKLWQQWYHLNKWANFFSVLFILLYNIVLVLPYINMNLPWVYLCSQSWTPLPPPSSITLGHPSAPAPSILYPASNLDWRFISCMILYMFQCHSPKSSHPRPLPQSPKDYSIHLCLFCCLAYRVIVTIFLNSIYMC